MEPQIDGVINQRPLKPNTLRVLEISTGSRLLAWRLAAGAISLRTSRSLD